MRRALLLAVLLQWASQRYWTLVFTRGTSGEMATRVAEDEDGEKIIFPDCPCAKGPVFTRWKERVLDIGCGRGDEDASWSATLQGTDPAAGLSNAQVRRRAVRRRETYAALMRTLKKHPHMLKMVRTEASNCLLYTSPSPRDS